MAPSRRKKKPSGLIKVLLGDAGLTALLPIATAAILEVRSAIPVLQPALATTIGTTCVLIVFARRRPRR